MRPIVWAFDHKPTPVPAHPTCPTCPATVIPALSAKNVLYKHQCSRTGGVRLITREITSLVGGSRWSVVPSVMCMVARPVPPKASPNTRTVALLASKAASVGLRRCTPRRLRARLTSFRMAEQSIARRCRLIVKFGGLYGSSKPVIGIGLAHPPCEVGDVGVGQSAGPAQFEDLALHLVIAGIGLVDA